MRSAAGGGLDYALECAICTLLSFIDLSIMRGGEKAFVLRRIVGLGLRLLLHSPTIS